MFSVSSIFVMIDKSICKSVTRSPTPLHIFIGWIMPLPINCAAYGENPEGRPECERGYYAPIFQESRLYCFIMYICVQCEVLVIWLLHLSIHCIHLLALATLMY